MRRAVSLSLGALGVLAVGACSRRESPAPPESTQPTTLAAVLPLEPAAAASVAPAAVTPAGRAPRSLSGKKVLHVGDSMVGGNFGLTRALEAKLDEEGAKIVRHTKVSESLSSFDKSSTLKDLIRTHNPDIVIINLGANDTLAPFPSAYVHSVENIAKRAAADGRECWWIGPPSWKGADTGLVSMLRDNAGACHFFDSTKLELDRASDGIHPNDRGAAKWANAFWTTFREANAK
jgi:lysophospholipase L1-like esterase